MSEYEKIRIAIREPWTSLLMDGRNEHGTHFLEMSPDNLFINERARSEMLDSSDPTVERIFSEAESLGYVVGCVIVVSCTAYEDEYGYHYELSKLDNDLTRLIFGDPEEQIKNLKAIQANPI